MGFEKTVIVVCDLCGDAYTPATSTLDKKKARAESRDEGWKDGPLPETDHCPDCAEEGVRP